MRQTPPAADTLIVPRGTWSLPTTCLALVALLATAAPHGGAQSGPAPVKPSRKIDFTTSLGFSQASGNANALTANATNTLRIALAGWSVQQDLAFFYGEANETVNTNFWNGGLRGDRTVADRVSLFVASRYDRNVLQGIANRFQQGFGVTVKAVERPREKLQVALGGSLFSQQLTDGSVAKVSRAFPAARAAIDFRRQLTGVAYVRQSAEFLPAVGDTARSYFVNAESAVVAPLSRSLGLKVGYIVRYNSEPPVRNNVPLRTTDTFFSSGLTLTF